MTMHKIIHSTGTITLNLFITVSILATACSTSRKGLFTQKSAHEQYASRITDAGLETSELGLRWFAAAQKAVSQPLSVTVPYKEAEYFAAEKPDAAGLLFSARRGEKLVIQIDMKPAGSFRLFAELLQPGKPGSAPSLLATADTTTWKLEYAVEADGLFILRLQPELLKSGGYDLSISTAPTLAFPVPSTANPKIGSFWGDNRDGGKRSHEGIDIFGKFRTPVVAAADGVVTSTRENNLGGKVVFLRPDNASYTLYYAHLDAQLVREGQRVHTGDTVGLMGNTGNAKNTATHLHFGIYTGNGAIDPMPFVLQQRAPATPVNVDTDLLQKTARVNTATQLYPSPSSKSASIEKLQANSVIAILAGTASWYKVALIDGREGFVEGKAVSGSSFKKQTVKVATPLLDKPEELAAVKTTIPTGNGIQLMGVNGAFYYVQYGEERGWVKL